MFLELFVKSFIENAVIYTVFSVPSFFVFWIVGKKYWSKIRIQEIQRATSHHFLFDIKYSILTFFVSAFMFSFVMYFFDKGYNLVYTDVEKYGWVWIGVSFSIALVINDTFFYWAHRAMHLPKLYNFFHRVHHESTDPSPLTSYSFHPSEAVVENLVMFVIPFLLPMHVGVILAFQLFDMTNNILAHLGYELYPKGWTKWFFFKYKTVSTHHNMHHQLFNGNYALYFTWWDRWMGTEFKDYEQRHSEIFERGNRARSEGNQQEKKVSEIKQESNIGVLSHIQSISEEVATSRKTTIEANIYHNHFTFVGDRQHTVLEAGLEQNIPMPFSCRKGRCGTCKMKCIHGKVTMKEHKALSKVELLEGYILTCQSFPETETLQITNE